MALVHQAPLTPHGLKQVVTEAAQPAGTLQGGLINLEKGLLAAHEILDHLSPRDYPESPPAGDGALATIERAASSLSDLHSRLTHIADCVGRL